MQHAGARPDLASVATGFSCYGYERVTHVSARARVRARRRRRLRGARGVCERACGAQGDGRAARRSQFAPLTGGAGDATSTDRGPSTVWAPTVVRPSTAPALSPVAVPPARAPPAAAAAAAAPAASAAPIGICILPSPLPPPPRPETLRFAVTTEDPGARLTDPPVTRTMRLSVWRDGSLSLVEPREANSGRAGGTFLGRCGNASPASVRVYLWTAYF